MLDHLRKQLPDIESATETTIGHVKKAAGSAALSAKAAAGQAEIWAKDGVGSVKMRPLTWSAASLGFGALIGGLYALWHRAKPKPQAAVRTVPARARAKKTLRAKTAANSAASKPARKRVRKTTARATETTPPPADA